MENRFYTSNRIASQTIAASRCLDGAKYMKNSRDFSFPQHSSSNIHFSSRVCLKNRWRRGRSDATDNRARAAPPVKPAAQFETTTRNGRRGISQITSQRAGVSAFFVERLLGFLSLFRQTSRAGIGGVWQGAAVAGSAKGRCRFLLFVKKEREGPERRRKCALFSRGAEER